MKVKWMEVPKNEYRVCGKCFALRGTHGYGQDSPPVVATHYFNTSCGSYYFCEKHKNEIRHDGINENEFPMREKNMSMYAILYRCAGVFRGI